MQRGGWLVLALLFLQGCGYGEVNPQAYQCAKALYNVSNRKLGSHVPKVQQQIAESLAENTITPKEARWLKAIAEDAAAERWQEAMQAARQLMEDQKGR